MESPDSIHGIVNAVLSKHHAANSLSLDLGGLIIRVQSNFKPLLDELRTYFGSFVSNQRDGDITVYAIEDSLETFPYSYQEKEPDPGKTRIKEEYIDLIDGRIVRKRLTGLTLIFNGNVNLAVGPCLRNSNQIVNFINNRFIEWMLRRGGLLAHAGGACHDNRGLALAGFSGSGKSTLALHLLNQGTSFVSNDRLVVRQEEEGLTMFGIPKHPRVNPGTLLSIETLRNVISEKDRRTLQRLDPDQLWNLEQKHDVIIDEFFGSERFQLRALMNGLLILNWKRNNDVLSIQEVNISSRRDLLSAFMKSPGLFFMPAPGENTPDFSPERYIEILRGCPVFEATGGVDFEGATRFCLEFLGQGWKDNAA